MKNFPKNTLILVADGTKATFYRNDADNGLELRADDTMSQKFVYHKGAARVPTEMKTGELEEATFAKHLADTLYTQAHAGGYDNLVLIADPDTLGEMRPSLHKEVQQKIVCELPKTLTNSTIQDIEKTLKAA